MVWLAVLIVLAALAWWVARRRRGPVRPPRRRPEPTRPRLRTAPPDASWRTRPQPGEIWWADVPYEDGSGHKVRPCLVLRTHRRQVDVLKITSQDRSARSDHLEIPTTAWDRKATHNSFLDLTDPFRLRDAAFSRKAGTIDDKTWRAVRRMHDTGWVA
nr:type II toxin-antitoxin system PemK/MazF family toxin [Planosporangium mesophilum]